MMTKEEIKKLLLSFTQEDYYKNVDLHIHSYESDGTLSPIEIVKQAKERNLKYIAIADHNTIDAYINTNILAEDIVIPAVEFDCYYKGNLLHILGYGINIDSPVLKSMYSQTKAGRSKNIVRLFNLRHPNEVINKIKESGGIAIWAHPACCWTFSLEKMLQDLIEMGIEGIEVYYPYHGLRGILKFYSKEHVNKLADKYNLIKTGGTDSHGKKLFQN